MRPAQELVELLLFPGPEPGLIQGDEFGSVFGERQEAARPGGAFVFEHEQGGFLVKCFNEKAGI